MNPGITPDQAHILFQETDAIRQELIELRARERARSLVMRQALFKLIDDIEAEWCIEPRTRELRERVKVGQR